MIGDVASLRAIESLRCGVPNGNAVIALGSNQGQIVRRFTDLIASQPASPGFFVQGGFGSGKSHILNLLREIALENNFACSIVPVGKDVTLSATPSVFKAAVRELRLPGKSVGGSCAEIVDGLNLNGQRYAEFLASYLAGKDATTAIFAATLQLYERYQGELDVIDYILDFWDGAPCKIADIKRDLKAIGIATLGLAAPADSRIALDRFQFVGDLLVGAGYAGWVLLIDEAELIAKLSRLSRAKSYLRLAALMGAPGFTRPSNVTTVAAITDDLWYELLQNRDDRNELPRQLAYKHPELAAHAITALDFLTEPAQTVEIQPATEIDKVRIVDKVRLVYEAAYGAQNFAMSAEGTSIRNMRELVKHSVACADLGRLYPGEVLILDAAHIETDLDEELGYESEETS